MKIPYITGLLNNAGKQIYSSFMFQIFYNETLSHLYNSALWKTDSSHSFVQRGFLLIWEVLFGYDLLRAAGFVFQFCERKLERKAELHSYKSDNIPTKETKE